MTKIYKKRKTLVIKLLCIALMLILTSVVFVGCGETEDGSGKGKGTLFFAGGRPDYNGIFDYDSGYTPSEAVDRVLTLADDAGVAFKDGTKTTNLKFGASMPEVVVGKQGVEIAGWYNVNDTTKFWKSVPVLRDKHPTTSTQNGVDLMNFSMPNADLTVAPFFVEAGKRPLIAASSHFDNATGTNYVREGTKFFDTDLGKQIGAEISYNGTASTGDNGRFKFMTACANDAVAGTPGLLSAGTHTFNFWFSNLCEETLMFQAYQVSAGTTLIEGANTDVITLEPGKSTRASITVEIVQNRNAQTIIYLRQDQTAAKLGIVMSKNA